MDHQKHPKHLEQLGLLDFLANFPWQKYPDIFKNQKEALEIIARNKESVMLELPTGSGKTAVGYTFLKTLEKAGWSPLFYITPTKTLVDQVKNFHPDVKTVYGRNEYECLYLKELGIEGNAEQVACTMIDCPHRIDDETGKTEAPGVDPCPYLFARYQARQGGIVVCTIAFYLFTHLFHKEKWPTPAALVIDEVHDISQAARLALSYEITDYHLKWAIKLLTEIEAEDEAKILGRFLEKMVKIIKAKPAKKPTILEDGEIKEIMRELVKVNSWELLKKIKTAIRAKKIDIVEHREVLERVERIAYDLTRYLHSFEYSLTTQDRRPLNYAFSYYEKERDKSKKVQYRLYVKVHAVGPLIRSILSPLTVSYSATIGNADVLAFDSGVKAPFYSFGSDFPAENTRVFLPTDTPNLAVKSKSKQEPTKVLRRIAKICRSFIKVNIRTLMVVVSEKERQKFMQLCAQEGVNAISYGNGVKPKEAAADFKNGIGDVLVGTEANYAEGIDLPGNIAQLTFCLRPGYPNPSDPAAIFEERKFGSARWQLWNWRVMLKALQVRGRVVRSPKDLGVTIFISQQYRRFLFAALPEWLKESYRAMLTFDECVKETKDLIW